jgi:hypothetical protein
MMSKSEKTEPAAENISLEQWIVLERLRLEEFAAFWRNGQNGHDANLASFDFPVRQPVGEWDEQYRSWGGA